MPFRGLPRTISLDRFAPDSLESLANNTLDKRFDDWQTSVLGLFQMELHAKQAASLNCRGYVVAVVLKCRGHIRLIIAVKVIAMCKVKRFRTIKCLKGRFGGTKSDIAATRAITRSVASQVSFFGCWIEDCSVVWRGKPRPMAVTDYSAKNSGKRFLIERLTFFSRRRKYDG